MKYFGHITRHNTLEKLVLQGKMEGARRKGRPRRKWTDDIEEWVQTKNINKVTSMTEKRTVFRARIRYATS